MSRSIPIINTASLTLRGMRAEDFSSYAKMWSDPEITAQLEGDPWSRAKSWQAFLEVTGHWQITGFGHWMVQLHRVPAVVGQFGFSFNNHGLGEDFDIYPEAKWVLSPAEHGAGYGYEAAKAAHDWFDRIVKGPLVCRVAPEHDAALHLAARMGYAPLRESEYGGQRIQLLVRKRPPE